MWQGAWPDADDQRVRPPIAGERPSVWIDEFPADEIVVHVSGEIDTLTVADFAADLVGACVRSDQPRLVVDLAEVEFLGAAGLRVLLELWRLCRRSGLEFVARDPSPAALRLIELGCFGMPLQLSARAS